MRRIIHCLGLAIALITGLGSCANDVDLAAERRELNEKNFASFATKADYERVSLPGLSGDYYIYMKYLERGEESAPMPKATDRVKIHYKLYSLTSFLSESPVMLQNNLDKEVATLTYDNVSGYVSGFQIAVQNMRVGDKAGVVIPWYLGYGAQATAILPSYSATYFEITLHAIQ